MRKAIVVMSFLLMTGWVSANANVNVSISPPEPPEKESVGQDMGQQKLNTAAGYEMIKTPNRIKVIIKRPPPDYGLIIQEFTRLDYSPAESTAVKLQFVEPKGKVQQSAVGNIQSQGKEKKESVSQETVYLEGECYVPEKVEIKTFERNLTLPCVFGTETGSLDVVLASDAKTGALMAIPKLVKVGDKAYQVVRGIVTTKDGSLNVADEVNRQYLKRILASGVVSGVNAGFEGYREYAENKNTQTYAVNGGTVIQEKSIPANYPLISAVLGAVEGMAKAFESIIQSKYQAIPTIFIVKPKTLVFKGEVKAR